MQAPINAMVKWRRGPPRLIGGRLQIWCLTPYTEASSVSQGAGKNSLIGKNGNQLFEKIMLKQRDEIVIQLNLVES
jgi:hypothetical protein